MNLVEPIRDPLLVKEIAQWLQRENERDYVFFMTGIYSALRVSDMLTLRVKDSKNLSIRIQEQKTKKLKVMAINPALRKALDNYARGKAPEEYLFRSRQGYNQPIDRSTAYRIMQKIGDQFGISNLGCHSLRKTFGYHFYLQNCHEKGTGIYTLMKILNHSDPAITLRYIGISYDEMSMAVSKFRIF